ncbi:hypothetical protein GCM10027425_07980 [Alteromonas gracilis]
MRLLPVLACLLVLSACSSAGDPEPERQESPAARTPVPELGACRVLEPADVEQASDDTETVPCTEEHTAETFAIGTFPDAFAEAAYDDARLGRWIYERCGTAFATFLGGNDSAALRSMLSWAWFRAPEADWEAGARWYRCDVVGGRDDAEAYRALPRTAKGLLSGPPDDDWLLCARGERFPGSAKVACSTPHDWRAVTAVRVSLDPTRPDRAAEPFPGPQVVSRVAQNLCSDSVLGYLNYPVIDFDYAVTAFGRTEWELGDRRAICWARSGR